MQTKFHYIILGIICSFFAHCSNAQSFDWAYAAGGIGNDVGTAIATDADGNLYITGNVSGGGYFGSNYVSGTVYEVFLAKYDANGNALWAKSYGGLKNEKAFSLVLSSNAIYLCGYFEDTATFGNTTLISKGQTDVFVMKTDLNGNEIWTKQAGGTNEDIAYGITVDDAENVYVCGTYKNQMFIDTAMLSTTNPYTESFIFSLDKNSTLRWAKTSKGNNNNSAFGIAWNKNNAISVCGFLGNKFAFDSIQISSQTSSYDAYISSFDIYGNIKWLKQIGSAAEDQAMAVTCDHTGNSYITGYTGGAIKLGNDTLNYSGWNDIFVTKFDVNGNLLWARQGGGSKLDLGTSITLDNLNNVYVAGMFEKTASFSGKTINDVDRGVVLVSYDSNGNIRFAQGAGDVQTEAALGVAVNAEKAYLTGYYLYKCKFGNYALPYADFFNIFITAFNFPHLVSIQDFDKEKIQFYPNPTEDILNINAIEDLKLCISTIHGKILLETEIYSGSNQMNISKMDKGILLLQIQNSKGDIAIFKLNKM